jgi:hypothetical protein
VRTEASGEPHQFAVPLGQLAAVHHRHDQIPQQEPDLVRVLL